MLMTHYREPIDFSVKRLEEAEAERERAGELRSALEFLGLYYPGNTSDLFGSLRD
jgi:cysteinyl-tRNA synthetase